MDLTYKYHSIDDTRYAYTDTGKGDVLVLLHGFTGTSGTWQPFIDQWKDSYRVVTVDLPGHGKTSGDANLSMRMICQHVSRLFDFLAIEKCHLLGYSMGGRTALSFAMWYPLYIETLTLESASPGLHTKEERAERVEKDTVLAKRLQDEGIKSFVDFWEAIPLFKTQERLTKSMQEEVRTERLNQSAYGLAASLTSVGTGVQPSWWDHLDDLTMPICLIVGEEDEKFVRLNERMAAQCEGCTYHIVTGAGHAVHIEQPKVFAQLVEQFIYQY